MSTIDEVRQRADIVEVIGQYVRLTKSGRTFRGLCPFHSEKNPSFFVYPEQQTWHCFGACSTGGDVFSFIMKKEGADFGDALRLLADRVGVTISARSRRETEGKDRLYQINQVAAQYFHDLLLNSPAGEKARKYVAGRGLSREALVDFQLGFSLNSWDALKRFMAERGYSESELLEVGLISETEAGKTHDRFRNLLMFPIFDTRGRTTGFGARVLDDSLPKYMNSPQTPVFDKSSSLYGINRATAAIRQQNRAVLVEGYMDVIAAHQYGLHNVIASLGTSVTEKQVSTIKRLTRNITLALDSDTAGEEAMLRCVGYENSLDSEVKVIILPEGKDPDDVIKQDTKIWQSLVEGALPVIDYTFKVVTSKLDMTKASDKSLAVSKLLPIISEVKDDIRRDHYLNELAKSAGISYHSIESALSRIRVDRKAREPKAEALRRALQPTASNRVEEYCLALLLQHPELKVQCQELLPEYFANSLNREIFGAYKESQDISLLKERLDSAIWEHLDSIIVKSLRADKIEQKYVDCALRLQETYLRSLETKRQEALASAAESGGPNAELSKLQEQGIEISIQLGKIFVRKNQIRS
jgi:DNA primase